MTTIRLGKANVETKAHVYLMTIHAVQQKFLVHGPSQSLLHALTGRGGGGGGRWRATGPERYRSGHKIQNLTCVLNNLNLVSFYSTQSRLSESEIKSKISPEFSVLESLKVRVHC